MSLKVSTTGFDVVLIDLGITVVHQTIDRDLREEFTAVELRDSEQLTSAINDGDLTVKMSIHGSLFPISADDYDPDLLLIEELDTTQDEKHISHDELASKGDLLIVSSGVFPLNLNSTAAATRNLYSNEAWWVTWDAQVGDIVEIQDCPASGVYHIESLSDQQNFILEEDIVDSTGGTANVYHPGGATRVGVDPANLTTVSGDNVQEILENVNFLLTPKVVGAYQSIFAIDVPAGASDFVPFDTTDFTSDSSMHDTTISDSGTATGTQTSATLKDTSKSWTIDGFVGFTVQITSGTGSGQFRQITANTSDTLTVGAWTTTPDNTSVYRITEFSTRLVAPRDGYYQVIGHSAIRYQAKITGIYFYVNGQFKALHYTARDQIIELDIQHSKILELKAGDYVEMKIYNGAGVTEQLFAGQYRLWLQMAKVGL